MIKTDSPNIVCTVNHTMEDLQHKILALQILLVALPRENGKERLRQRREQYRVRRERNRRATAIQVGKMEGI